MTDFAATFDPAVDLELKREIDVPPALIWRCWTEVELLKQWFCPRPWAVSHAEIDLRPGGRFRTVMRGPEGEEFDNTGCFLLVVPQKLLVFTDGLGPGFRPKDGAFMTAAVTFEDKPGGGTRYTARAFHKDEAGRKQHEEMGFEQGWGAAWEQLVELARRM